MGKAPWAALAFVATVAGTIYWLRPTPLPPPLPPEQPPAPPPAPILPTLEQRVARYISEHEGIRLIAYRDSRKNPTIGIGFSLSRPDARAKLQAVGADLDLIRARKQSLTKDQAFLLLEDEVDAAIAAARRVVPTYARLPWQVQVILADMAYNLGATGLSKFDGMELALGRGDYAGAARELRRTPWARQVGWRAERAALVLTGRAALD